MKKYCYIKNRKCWVCKIIKHRSSFYKSCYDKYGLQKACKECQNKRNLKYYFDHKKYFQNKNKEHYKKENNPIRYKKYRKIYLIRRKKYSCSVIGRFNGLLCSARNRAKKQKRQYNISLKWLLKQYDKQNKKCKLTNILLEFKTNVRKRKQFLPFSPSLHRLNEYKGYTKDNVSLVCTGINIAMNRFKREDFKKIVLGYLLKEKAYNEALAISNVL